MDKISRGEALDKMLLGIYGNRNVNFENQKVIINDDRIRKTLYSPTSQDNVKHLLEITFYNKDVIFEDKKGAKSFNRTIDKVIDNTVEYFRWLGIFIPEVMNSTERHLLGRRMCFAILEKLLPAIFSNINTEKKSIAIENDDISPEFNKAVERIKSKYSPGDFWEQLYIDIKASDVEKIYDSDYSKDECNYGICVRTYADVVFKELKVVPLVYYFACNNDSEQSEASNLYSDPFDGLQKEMEYSNDSFEKLTSGLAAKEILDNINFVSPYYYNKNHENRIDKTNNEHKEYRLRLNVKIPNSDFIPRYFYFMTKLNEDVVREKYPNCKSSAMLNNKLMEKAIDKIRTDYRDKITQYYKETLANIENICRNFLSIDIESILSSKKQNVSDFKKALSSLCNENDIDEMWKICQEQHLSAEQTSRYIYCGIEKAIRDFSSLILDLSFSWQDCEKGTVSKPDIIVAIEDYISKSDINGHISTLTKLLRNPNIEVMSKLRKFKNFKWNPNAGIKMNYRNDSNPVYFTEKYIKVHHIKEKDIYCCLKDRINLYCDNLKKLYRL
ncbi:MAG TPA: hypothetical protein P5092_11045 [Ruminococcus sp.]|nr:hypothetical protein [Ruminococcus sp.]